jgi:predicted nucleic acid-binding protein
VIYFDSNYIVRLYYEDSGFAAVRQLAATDSIACSQHGRPEVVAAFHRKYREGNMTADFYRATLKQFCDDAKTEAFQWLNISSTTLDRIEKVYEQLPATIFLRSADALHLASAAENSFKEIYSNDEKLLAAASYFGLKRVNII